MRTGSCDSPTGVSTATVPCRKPSIINRRKTFNGRQNTADSGEIEETAAVLRLDLVLDKIERRLKQYEDVPAIHLEGKLKTAYEALSAIFKDGVSRVGDEAKGRALVVVRILENKCSAVLSVKDSMPDKIHGARKFLESALLEVESSYHNNLNSTKQSVVEKIAHLQDEIQRGTQEAAKRVATIRTAVQAASTRLLEYSELPFEWQNNPYVLTGYRFYESPVKCGLSAFQLHNETGNIWTHLGGFLFLCVAGLYMYPQTLVFSNMSFHDRLIFFVFMVAALKCLVCSALWHTFAHIANLDAMKSLACLDYVGISVLIAASIVTMEWHGFYCSPTLQACYVGFTSSLGILGVIIPWFPWFDRVENRAYRIMFFLGIAISGIVPISHIIYSQSFWRTWTFFSPVIKSLLCYIFGVAVYAAHFPEKVRPGLFDRLGNSHQIWHIAILGGIWFVGPFARSWVTNGSRYHFKAVQSFQISSVAFACRDYQIAQHSFHII